MGRERAHPQRRRSRVRTPAGSSSNRIGNAQVAAVEPVAHRVGESRTRASMPGGPAIWSGALAVRPRRAPRAAAAGCRRSGRRGSARPGSRRSRRSRSRAREAAARGGAAVEQRGARRAAHEDRRLASPAGAERVARADEDELRHDGGRAADPDTLVSASRHAPAGTGTREWNRPPANTPSHARQPSGTRSPSQTTTRASLAPAPMLAPAPITLSSSKRTPAARAAASASR